MNVYFTPLAEQQADEIDLWWRANRTKSPALFARELAEAKALIANTPRLGQLYAVLDDKEILRVFLPRTRHHLYYSAESGVITVHAVWGAPREHGPQL